MSLNKLGRYDIIRVLGKGAMGLVYEARDPNLERRVAIKTIKVENLSEEAAAEYEARFRTEARSAARLQHPNIVSVYDSDRHGDMAFLVMEFIQGEDLKHHLDAGRRFTLEQSLGMIRELLSALDYAHRQNIVHRDVKPANLLIEPDGRVKLTDFGVARIQDSGEATRTQGSMVGTLKYMSPEQVQGLPIDARADLFAVGIVLYQLLTGKRPFDGDTDFAIIQQIVGHVPAAPSQFNPQLPPAIDAVVSRALAKKRDQRFATAQEFAAVLLEASHDISDPTVVPPPGTPGRRAGNATDTGQRSRGGSTIKRSSSGTDSGSTVTQELELVYWKDIKDSEEPEDFKGFLSRFPEGIYADLAHRRLKRVGGTLPSDDSGTESGTVPASAFAQTEWTRLQSQHTPQPPAGESAAAPSDKLAVLPTPPQQLPPAPAVPSPPPSTARASSGTPAKDTLPGVASHDHTIPIAPSAVKAQKPSASGRPSVMAFALGGGALLVLAVVAFVAWPSAKPPAGGLPAEVALPAAKNPGSAAAPTAAAVPAPASATQPSPALATKPPPVKRVAGAPEKPAVSAKPTSATGATVAATIDKPAPAPVNAAGGGNPQQACESRVLLGFQICMNEQCAKPAFANHPVCAERRAMDKLRQEVRDGRN